ncbi:MAG: hypothetical protein MI924_22290 [Chloroflexales bacterium]|nr:hypothetical protein [Chloroflexales bacterium]
MQAFTSATADKSQLVLELHPAPIATMLPNNIEPDTAAEIDAFLDRRAQGRLSAEQALAQLAQLAATLEQAAARQLELRQHLADLAESYQTLLAIRQAAQEPQSALSSIVIDLATSPLTPLVWAWRLQDAQEHYDIAILHVSRDSSVTQKLRLHGGDYACRRIAFSYEPQQVAPTLALQALSMAESDAKPTGRRRWVQYPLSDYDLTLYTEQYRCKGSVATRRSAEPLLVQSGPITLSYTPQAGRQLIVTEIRNEHGQLCGRVLRLLPIIP